MKDQTQIVELTQAETEQVEGGFIPLVWGLYAAADFAISFAVTYHFTQR